MGPVAASGGYWISSASDLILVGEQTITGSIGVFGVLPNIEKLSENFGLSWDVVKTGPSADIMTIARSKSTAEMQVVQGYVDKIYERFLNLVSSNREIPMPQVREIAQGRVWLGVDAVELKLADKIGGLSDALNAALDLAKISEDFQVVEFPTKETPADAIENLLAVRKVAAKNHLEISAGHELLELEYIRRFLSYFNDPGGVYGILPWYQTRLGFDQLKGKIMNKEVTLKSNCIATIIPAGDEVTLAEGATYTIAQSLGNSVTLRDANGMYRVGEGHLSALGEDIMSEVLESEKALQLKLVRSARNRFGRQCEDALIQRYRLI